LEKRGVAGRSSELGAPLAPGWWESFGDARQSDAIEGGMLLFFRVALLVDLGRRERGRVLPRGSAGHGPAGGTAIVRELDRIVAEH
jgi:hypothetical protein